MKNFYSETFNCKFSVETLSPKYQVLIWFEESYWQKQVKVWMEREKDNLKFYRNKISEPLLLCTFVVTCRDAIQDAQEW